MYVTGRVHDPEHGFVGVASKAGFYSINREDTRVDRPHDWFLRSKCYLLSHEIIEGIIKWLYTYWCWSFSLISWFVLDYIVYVYLNWRCRVSHSHFPCHWIPFHVGIVGLHLLHVHVLVMTSHSQFLRHLIVPWFLVGLVDAVQHGRQNYVYWLHR